MDEELHNAYNSTMNLKSSLLVGSVVIDSHKPIGPCGFF